MAAPLQRSRAEARERGDGTSDRGGGGRERGRTSAGVFSEKHQGETGKACAFKQLFFFFLFSKWSLVVREPIRAKLLGAPAAPACWSQIHATMKRTSFILVCMEEERREG